MESSSKNKYQQRIGYLYNSKSSMYLSKPFWTTHQHCFLSFSGKHQNVWVGWPHSGGSLHLEFPRPRNHTREGTTDRGKHCWFLCSHFAERNSTFIHISQVFRLYTSEFLESCSSMKTEINLSLYPTPRSCLPYNILLGLPNCFRVNLTQRSNNQFVGLQKDKTLLYSLIFP